MSKFLIAVILIAVLQAAYAMPVYAQAQPRERPSDTSETPSPEIPVGFKAIEHKLKLTLVDGGPKKLLIIDFRGPNNSWSPFSAWLAEQFLEAIQEEGCPWEIIDRRQLSAKLEARHASPRDLFDGPTAQEFAREVGADALLSGSFGYAENGIGIALNCVSLAGGDCTQPGILSLIRGKLPLTPDIEAKLGGPLKSLHPKDGIFRSGEGGISFPECITCPWAKFSPDALRKKAQGSVLLDAVIDSEGSVLEVRVLKSPGFGLDKIAVKTVKDWKLKPATDVDGNPVSVWQKIDVTFKLN